MEGTTLWLDFPKDAKPEHFGHWAEVLAPTFSHLSLGAAQAAVAKVCNGSSIDPTLPPIRTVIIPNLRRTTILATPWIMHVLKLAVTPGLGPQGAAVSPRLLFWDDLEATDLSTWLIFERAIHIYTRHNHPKTGREVGFASPELGAAFAAAACEAANVSRPQAPPRTITYLMSPIGETIINNGDVLSALRAAAEGTGFTVRPYSPTASVPFSSLVSVMARTGVLVARHGPLMANALFLPPGAAVVELLPHNWVSKGRGEVYVNLTRTTAVVGHVAWFPKSAAEMEYEGAGDARYGNWKAEECSSDDCVDAHARAALRVDPAALEKLAKDVVAAVVKGEPPDTLHKRHPWPRRADPSGRTGLWWDVDQ